MRTPPRLLVALTLGLATSSGTPSRAMAPALQVGCGRRHVAPSLGVAAMRVESPGRGGRLPPEVIQRVMRDNFGQFRVCYENGLRNCPNLQGRVSVRFTIARDGSVKNARAVGSDLPDRAVSACVVRKVGGLRFPMPEGGPVTVVYPIMFSPGG